MEINEKEKEELRGKARKAVKNHVFWALGVGLIPIPVADIFALTTVQIKMLAELADTYQVRYTKESLKVVVSSLLASTASTLLAVTTGSTIKAIPVIGQTAGAAAMSIYGGAITYAIGEVFIRHFGQGGTLLDFDPAKAKDYTSKMYKEGVGKIKNWRKNKVVEVDGVADTEIAKTPDPASTPEST